MDSLATLTQRIDALLPQTQCTRCGYPACRDYANAIATDAADINQCPPGGMHGIELLAQLLGRQPKPLNPTNGVEKPREIAVIDEEICIGCTKCIQACPVDAISGRGESDAYDHCRRMQWMRTVHRTLPCRLHRHGSGER